MSFLSMVEAKLPPGFRFHPRDDELVCDYLSPRASAAAAGAGFYGFPALVDIDLNKCEPWDLPETARIRGKEWYFYSVRDRKYATGQRTNRATVSGYWKATGKDRHVLRKGMLVGMRKTLVFYQGRAPRGKKTQWVMHEFRMEGPSDSPKFSPKVKLQRSEYDCKFPHFQSSQDLHGPASQQEGWVLCRVFYKSRSLSQKRSAEVCEEDTGSSSLPPLIDSQMMNYGQAPFGNAGLGQVPCFSSFSACQAAPPELITTERSLLPDLTSCLNSLSCDKKAMKVVLSQLSKMEDNQEINERCFSESAIPSLWNPFASF